MMSELEQGQLGVMGQYVKTHTPKINFNTFIHSFTDDSYAFEVITNATIVTDVQYPDVSFYQGEIDYEIMRTKTNAIILRAGQNLWEDEQFERNYREARRTGLLIGVYWFYDDRIDPGRQAEFLIRILQGKTVDMEVILDWETTYGGMFKGLKNVVAMMQIIESFGYRVATYTGYYWFTANSNPITNANQYAYLKNRPLHLAWYTSNPANVRIPNPWLDLTHWQWGTPEFDWGQKSLEIDMNFYNGTQEEFENRYGTGQPPTGGTVSYLITPDKSIGSKIRSNHTTSVSNQIGTLQFGRFAIGTEKWGDGIIENWLHIQEYENPNGDRVALDGWIAERSGGTKVATMTEVIVNPPPTSDLPTLNIDLSDPEGNYPPIHIEWKPNEPAN